MKEMLKYQQLDLEIKKIEEDVNQHSDRKNALKMQQVLKDCQAKLAELEAKCESAVKAYTQYKTVYNNMAKNLELIEKNSDTNNAGKVEGLIEAGDAIVSNLSKLESEIASIIATATSVENEYNNIMKNARNAKANLQKYKDSFNAVKEDAEQNLKAKRAELEAQGAKVNKQLLAKYKAKSADIKKVFVPQGSGTCGGCRMELSAGQINALKTNKFIDCENCGRIIYLQDREDK